MDAAKINVTPINVTLIDTGPMKLVIPANLIDNSLLPLQKMAEEGKIRLARAGDEGDPIDDVSDASAIFRWRWKWSGPQIDRILAIAPQVRWIHSSMAGIEPLLTPPVMERDITITNGAGTYAVPIAEWVMLAMLTIVKRLPEILHDYQAQVWKGIAGYELGELSGKTLLILGAGQIGSEIARRAAAFDMRVWGSRRSARPTPNFERIAGEDEWQALLPEADFVVVALPLTGKTSGIIGEMELAAMKDSAWLINISRGSVIDEAALIGALEQHTVGGAWLDTTTIEPLPQDNPLWSTPNTIITPHITWWSENTNQRVTDLLLANLNRFLQGEPLINVVNKQVGY